MDVIADFGDLGKFIGDEGYANTIKHLTNNNLLLHTSKILENKNLETLTPQLRLLKTQIQFRQAQNQDVILEITNFLAKHKHTLDPVEQIELLITKIDALIAIAQYDEAKQNLDEAYVLIKKHPKFDFNLDQIAIST